MPAPVLTTLEARGIRATLDHGLGQLADFAVKLDDGWHRPLARVPWADDPPPCPEIAAAPHLARMSGDFFCAPFTAADVEPAPLHGWPANSNWSLLERLELADGVAATWELDRAVMGARLRKRWRLRHGDPFLYQEHVFEGGAGRISLAHHVMVDVRGGAELTLSPRAHAESPALSGGMVDAFATGLLAYPARATDLRRFPRRDGGTADLLRYPLGAGHEDFAMLVDAVPAPPPGSVGWAAVRRPAQGDCVLLVKPADVLPQTMLWISNGGRDTLPWAGRHVGVLGVEDACAFSAHGHAASMAPNPLSDAGVPTCHALGGTLRIRHAVGVLAAPDGPLAAAALDARAQAALAIAREATP
ncbi:MAG: hypothetical protein JJU42_05870 [Rhodobacteraceae bacterium]|nr:hypothetical protein [Paracoccaceae bacterium]